MWTFAFAVSEPETFHTRTLFDSSDPMNPATHMHSNEDPDYNPELEAVSDPGSVPAVGPAHGLRRSPRSPQTVTKAGMVDPDNVPPEAYDARLERVPVAEVRERRAARAELARALVALRAAKVRFRAAQDRVAVSDAAFRQLVCGAMARFRLGRRSAPA